MDSKKVYDCDMIQDLLPLYQDQACSETSKAIVEEHLKNCSKCQILIEKLSDTSVENQLTEQKESVLRIHARKERRRTTTIGIITAGVFMIPVVVSLIVNLATGHALDWFYIVLTSLLVAASLSIVPLLVREHTILWTLISFIVSLALLLFVVCLYTGGSWFLIAMIPTLFGLSVIFTPYILYQFPLPKLLARHKGLLAMLWDTLGLYVLIYVIGCYYDYEAYWRISLGATRVSILLPWLIFLCIRYLKVHPLIKAGIITIITGIFSTFINDIIDYLIDGTKTISIIHCDFLHWNTGVLINANTYMLVLIVTIVTGISLIIAGIIKRQKEL